MIGVEDTRVLLLGASGFIGRWVGRELSARGFSPLLVVRDAEASRPLLDLYEVHGTVVEMDLRDFDELDRILEEWKPTVTYNLAGYGIDRSERDEATAFRINAELVGHLARRLADQRPPEGQVPTLVHVGSALEYGEAGEAREETPPRPTTLYGRSKLAGTETLVALADGARLRAVTARLFTVYGPGEHAGRLLPALIRTAGTGEPVPLTEGLQERDFTYVQEAAEGLFRLGASPAATGVVNVATGQLWSVRRFVEAAARLLAIPMDRLRFGELPTRLDEMRHPPVPLARLLSFTGWTPTIGIEAGIGRTLAFCGAEGPRPRVRNRPVHHLRSRCRGCEGKRLHRFLSLGHQPLANRFLKTPAEFRDEPRFPLDVYLCLDCGLVQLMDVVDPEVLFRDYVYVSGTSATIARHFEEYARVVTERLDLQPTQLVVEVASNDGTLLRHFREQGVRTLGVEPASNIAEMARAAGVDTIEAFFDSETARRIREEHGPAVVVMANNVLAHVDGTRDFLSGMASMVDEGGLVVVEVPYLGKLLERLEYDTIYHEHLCYFSVGALLHLYEAVGLSVVRLDHVPVHGGSIRLWAARGNGGHSSEAVELAAREQANGYRDPARYDHFARRVADNRERLRRLIERLRDDGCSLGGYGAPAKGNTLLNYCGIGIDLLPFTVDRNPLKVGRYTPGTHIPVLPANALAERSPDYCLLLAWNFADEIIEQEAEYRRRGGRYILPIPDPRVL